ncbi:MAG: Amidohydrolase [Spirochaetes bacterium ADurb.Bin133]|jgi:hypothetical protein|nr:MAG: Amidohydrolase [Spirochaetes bacterium ADurb.Bin133]
MLQFFVAGNIDTYGAILYRRAIWRICAAGATAGAAKDLIMKEGIRNKTMNSKIIDFHTHAFPDFLAEKAVTKLAEHSGEYKPFHMGSIKELLASMDGAGVDKSLVANIATKPEQIASILKWSGEIRSDRILPLASFYPNNPNWQSDVEAIKKSGFRGIKLHPLYQNFFIDDENLFDIYDRLQTEEIFILFHAGYDIAFGKQDNAAPFRIAKILKEFPRLTIIASHMGSWKDWDNVLALLSGKNLYFDTSFIHEIEPALRDKILSKHNDEFFLFGSDSPWLSQKQQIDFIDGLNISSDYKEKIFYKNGENFLRKYYDPLSSR